MGNIENSPIKSIVQQDDLDLLSSIPGLQIIDLKQHSPIKLSHFQLFTDIIIDYGVHKIDLSNKSQVVANIAYKSNLFENIVDNFTSLISNCENKEVQILCYNVIDKTFKTSVVIPNRFWEQSNSLLGVQVRAIRMADYLAKDDNCILQVKNIFKGSPVHKANVQKETYFLFAVQEFYYRNMDEFNINIEYHFIQKERKLNFVFYDVQDHMVKQVQVQKDDGYEGPGYLGAEFANGILNSIDQYLESNLKQKVQNVRSMEQIDETNKLLQNIQQDQFEVQNANQDMFDIQGDYQIQDDQIILSSHSSLTNQSAKGFHLSSQDFQNNVDVQDFNNDDDYQNQQITFPTLNLDSDDENVNQNLINTKEHQNQQKPSDSNCKKQIEQVEQVKQVEQVEQISSIQPPKLVQQKQSGCVNSIRSKYGQNRFRQQNVIKNPFSENVSQQQDVEDDQNSNQLDKKDQDQKQWDSNQQDEQTLVEKISEQIELYEQIEIQQNKEINQLSDIVQDEPDHQEIIEPMQEKSDGQQIVASQNQQVESEQNQTNQQIRVSIQNQQKEMSQDDIEAYIQHTKMMEDIIEKERELQRSSLRSIEHRFYCEKIEQYYVIDERDLFNIEN